MADNFISSPPALSRNATALVSALLLLSVGIYSAVRLDVNSVSSTTANFVVYQTKSGSTIRQKALVTQSGSWIGSGSVEAGRNQAAGWSGGLVLNQYGKICSRDTAGAGWTLCTTLAGTQSCRVAAATECPPRTP